MFHDIINKPPIYEALTITFLEQPSFHSLDVCEDKWFDKRNAHINIQSMILPRVEQLLYYSICDVQLFSNLTLPNLFWRFISPT